MKKIVISTLLIIVDTLISAAETYNRFSVSYNWQELSEKQHLTGDFNNLNTNGFSLNYNFGYGISSIFIETGINLNYGAGSKSFGDKFLFEDLGLINVEQTNQYIKPFWGQFNLKFTSFDVRIPINFVYRLKLNDKIKISPYVGINLKINLLDKYKDVIKHNMSNSEIKILNISDEYLETDWINLFSKNDVGDATWNRVQIGWQIGMNLNYRHFSMGLQFGTDFIPIYKYHEDKISTKALKVSIGYEF